MAVSSDEEGQILALIGALYDAALEPQLWQPLTAQLAHQFRAESGMLLVTGMENGGKFLGVTDNIRGDAWEDYEAYYYTQDEWIAGGLKRPGRALLGHELAPEEWYRKSAFLNELCVRAGIHSMVGAALPVAPDRTAFVGIHRPRNNEPFGTADVAQLNVLIPHLTRAIQLTMRLSDAGLDHQVALDGLERTHSATLVVDGNGRILFATRLAEAALREVGGLHAVNGRLFGADRVSSARLAHLIRGAADTAAGAALHTNCGGLAIEREDGRLPLTVLVAPFRPNRPVPGAQIPAALVFIRDPELGTVANEILTDLFGFTRAQAAVAAHMANGESLEQIALALRISLLTARDHLKAIFAKTGTSRQSQLVALLSRTVATLESRAAASE